jgi:uncharacterized membrane protein YjdF
MEKQNHFKRLWPVYLSLLVLLGFTSYFLFKSNFEFLVYTVSIGIIIWLIGYSDNFFSYPTVAKLGFSIWLFFHLLGGSLMINGIRLYDSILIPILGEPMNILKYDQVMHFICYAVFAIFVYAIINKTFLLRESKYSRAVSFFVIVLVAEGIGAVNEIIELSTVIFFNSTGVGDYMNNALDLVFNILGAILGTAIIFSIRKGK